MTALPPPLKWPGGKSAELERIRAFVPDDVDRYLEPFVGGGAVWFAMPPEVPAAVNDTSADLIDLYRRVQGHDTSLFTHLDGVDRWWQALTAFSTHDADGLARMFADDGGDAPDVVRERAAAMLPALLAPLTATVPAVFSDLTATFRAHVLRLVPAKLGRMRRVEHTRGHRLPARDVARNVEGAFKAACYTVLRATYNEGRAARTRTARQAALFFFLREFAYAAMFRFNRAGAFNVPYGGISYNRKDLGTKVRHLRSDAVARRLATTTLHHEDFASFLERQAPRPDDFVFLDPPYDSDFSEYDAAGFGPADHARLAATMASLATRFVLVIKATPTVRELYADPHWHVHAFDKRYLWTIKERNDRRATHLLITNVEPPRPSLN